jgi:hypothetical protein
MPYELGASSPKDWAEEADENGPQESGHTHEGEKNHGDTQEFVKQPRPAARTQVRFRPVNRAETIHECFRFNNQKRADNNRADADKIFHTCAEMK